MPLAQHPSNPSLDFDFRMQTLSEIMNAKIFLSALALLVASMLLSQCRTTKGFGEDLQHLGNKIEKEAKTTGY